MIDSIIEAFKANIIYTVIVVMLLGWFTYDSLNGNTYYEGNSVQRNAGYSGPVPHSGYGVRFYHK